MTDHDTKAAVGKAVDTLLEAQRRLKNGQTEQGLILVHEAKNALSDIWGDLDARGRAKSQR